MDLDLTQLEVAIQLGVTARSVDNWEHDIHPPKAARVRAIHNFLGYCPVGLDLSNLGVRLLVWRRSEGLTQREVAERIRCDETTLRALERGRTQFVHRRTQEAIERLIGGQHGASATDALRACPASSLQTATQGLPVQSETPGEQPQRRRLDRK